MLNFYKLIGILVSLQSLVITAMLPVYIPLQFIHKSFNSIEIPITMQIPTIILLTLIFNKNVIFSAFSSFIYQLFLLFKKGKFLKLFFHYTEVIVISFIFFFFGFLLIKFFLSENKKYYFYSFSMLSRIFIKILYW